MNSKGWMFHRVSVTCPVLGATQCRLGYRRTLSQCRDRQFPAWAAVPRLRTPAVHSGLQVLNRQLPRPAPPALPIGECKRGVRQESPVIRRAHLR